METARLQPDDVTFDKYKNADVNEASTNSTSNSGVGAPSAPAQNAPGYLEQAREALVSLAGTAQNAIGIETPGSTLHEIADKSKIDASLPTTETHGAKPGEHTGGVGALPGGANETGVAVLPDERKSVPSRELEGAYPGEKVGGVGALPGGQNEAGVAVLPDERAAINKTGAQSATHPSSEKADIKAAALVATHPSSGETNKPDVQSSAHAAAHPSSEKPGKADLKTAAAHPIETAKARRGSASSSSSSDGEDTPERQARKKASLKDKIAGGVKVATGKLTKDQEKVAEGQAQRGH